MKTIKELTYQLNVLKKQFRFYQIGQEIAKHDYNMWDPFDGLSKDEHERRYTSEIVSNRYVLSQLQKEIIETRKQLKKLNREQNGKNGVHYSTKGED